MSDSNQNPARSTSDVVSFLNSISMSPTPESVDSVTRNYEQFLAVADRYRNDEAFRRAIDDGSEDAFAAFGMEAPGLQDMDVRVVADTDELQHFVMLPDPNASLTDEQLSSIAGGSGDNLSSFSSLATAACSTLPSTIGTFSTKG